MRTCSFLGQLILKIEDQKEREKSSLMAHASSKRMEVESMQTTGTKRQCTTTQPRVLGT